MNNFVSANAPSRVVDGILDPATDTNCCFMPIVSPNPDQWIQIDLTQIAIVTK